MCKKDKNIVKVAFRFLAFPGIPETHAHKKIQFSVLPRNQNDANHSILVRSWS